MFNKKMLVLVGLLVLTAFAMTACAGPVGPAGPEGPQGPAGPQGEPGQMPAVTDLSCAECHNDTGTIAVKRAGWEISKHGSGIAMIEEYNRNSCTFCHSGNSFRAAVAAGQNFSQVENGATEPGRQDCYTCHQIHTTYTGEDWALRTTDAVTMVVNGATFDGGLGNLCVNCHQARRYMANFVDKTDPTKYAANVRFNTHLSPQADSLMGTVDVAAVLGIEGKPGAHYNMVENTCVGCHFGDGKNHSFKPQLSTCVACHADATNYDVNGFRTAFEEKFLKLEEALVAKGMLIHNEDGTFSSVPGTYDAQAAAALFAWGYIEEDASMGIHNPNYFNALIDAALAAIGE
ncbi:MAG: collagen-like protein [Chloroflexi bacterium]|nr:collagen-like protein [Chloroflexota bacterium]